MPSLERIASRLMLIGLVLAVIGILGAAQLFVTTDCAPHRLSVGEDKGTIDTDPIAYENLPEYQQQKFRDAVEAEDNEVPINLSRWDEAADSSGALEGRGRVEYDGMTYYARTYHFECNEFREIFVMGGVLSLLLGVGVGGIGLFLRYRTSSEG